MPGQGGTRGDVGRGEVVGARTHHHRAVAEVAHHRVSGLVGVHRSAEDDHEPLTLGGAQGIHTGRAGRASYLVEQVLAALRRRVPEYDGHATAVGPAQRAGPGGHGLVGLGAEHGVDHQCLEPGVPRAARLGGPGVDLGGGEGDLPRVAQDGGVDGGRVDRVYDVVDVRLHDLDPQPHQVDGLAERDHARQRPRCGPEDGGGGVAGRGTVVPEPEPVDEALDAGLEDLPHPGAALGRQVAEPGHVGEHPRHGSAAQGAGRAAECVGGPLPRRLVRERAAARGGGLRQGGGSHVSTLVTGPHGVTNGRAGRRGRQESRVNAGFPPYIRRVRLVESGTTATGDRRCRCASTACST